MSVHSLPLRMPVSELAHLQLRHLASGVDASGDELPASAGLQRESCAQFTGFTEWIGAMNPGLSLGWDWVVSGCAGVIVAVPGTLRTNLVLTDASGADLPREALLQCLASYLSQWPWQAAVLEHLKATPPLRAG
jgi:hypothetical protein